MLKHLGTLKLSDLQLHPAVKEAGILPEDGEEIAVQVAYTPKSHCFGCGELALDCPASSCGWGLCWS